MRKTLFLLQIFFLFCLFNLSGNAQEEDEKSSNQAMFPEEVQSTHSVRTSLGSVNYTAKAGYLTLMKEDGEEEARIFYIAYHKNNVSDASKRPITFSFNGGPGSSSVWLHLGVLGPRRVLMTDEGETLPPPYALTDNEYSWLDETDMVFIDPVSTGFSRAADEDNANDFHGYKQDIAAVAEFIRRYTSDNERWGSPKYVIGESYGTTRATGLSEHLINKYGMYLNGIILVSAITNFQTARFDKGNDLPYITFLPTYTASAWYHKKLEQSLLDKPLEEVLDEAEAFALGDYASALLQGDQLEKNQRVKVVQQLNKYTGLSETYIDRADLRLNIHKISKELLRDSKEVIGRFDSRYKAIDNNANGEYKEKDPSYQPTIQGCFSTCINDYLGRELGFKSKLPYEVLTGRVRPWDYSNVENQYLNTSENLRKAMVKNPHMKVWIANGYYDLATPYFATEYTIHHMGLPPHLKENISMTYYPAGHMMYLLKDGLIQMKEEATQFYKDSQLQN